MSKLPTSPRRESLASPTDALYRLNDCFAAVTDLTAGMDRADMGAVSSNNLASLLGLLVELNSSAILACEEERKRFSRRSEKAEGEA